MPKRVTETSTDYERPYRPLPIALLNAVGRAGGHLGLPGKLDVGSMIARARRKTGLASFGDEWFMEPLSVLVRSINAEADLTTLGRFIQKRRIEGGVGNAPAGRGADPHTPGDPRHRPRQRRRDRRPPTDRHDHAAPPDRLPPGDAGNHRLGGTESAAPAARGAGRPPRPDADRRSSGYARSPTWPLPSLPCIPPNTTPRRRTCSCSTCPS